MMNPAALPSPTAARARRARDQFDPARLPVRVADINLGKTYEAKLSAKLCADLPFPESGRYYVKWAGHRGLTLHVTRDRKTLYGRARGQSNGGWKHVGEMGELLDRCGTFPQIAAYALAMLGDVARGLADPTAERATVRAATRAAERTVADVVADYMATPTKYGDARSATTIDGDTGSIRRLCGAAWDRPMRALCNPATLADLFNARAAVSRTDAAKALGVLDTLGKRTPAYADLHLAVLGARNVHQVNPGAKAWRPCGYDQRTPSAIVAHWEKVAREATTANYRAVALRFYVSLFLPLRIGTLSALRWAWLGDDENDGGILRIPASAFKKTANIRAGAKVIEMPVPPRLYALMKTMRATATTALMFPSATDPHKAMGPVPAEFQAAFGLESVQWIGAENTGRQDGRYCTIHDGRRLAAGLTDEHGIGTDRALKGFLTHSHLRGSVTDRYKGPAPYRAIRALCHEYEAFLWTH